MQQFVIIPSLSLIEQKIQYLDLLTYAAVRRFINPSGVAFPSLEKISEKAGLGREFVITSLKRLEAAGLINIHKQVKKVNNYTFPKVEKFEKLPFELLDDENLSSQEKATLICLRQHFYSDSLTTAYNLQELAERLNLSYATIQRQIASLKKKNYITTQLRYFPTKIDEQTLMIEKQVLMLNQNKINWTLKEEIVKLHQTDLDIIDILERMDTLSPEQLKQELLILRKKSEIKKSYAEDTLNNLMIE